MKVGGQIPWNVTPLCETSQIYYLMGRTPYERRFGQPFKGPIIPFASLVEYHPITAKDQSRIHQFGKKVLPGLFLGYALYAERDFGRVTYWLQTLRSWRRWTHRKSTQKESMRKRWYFPHKKENSFFQSQMDESNPLEEIKTWEHPPRYGSVQGSLPPPPDSFSDACEAINDFWSMSGNFIFRHHIEPRVKLYSPREESFPIPLKYPELLIRIWIEYHLVRNLKKRCIKRNFKGIHDRFLRDPDFRKCMLEHDRDEDVCLKCDDLAEQDFTYRMSEPEYFHYRQNWWNSLKKSGTIPNQWENVLTSTKRCLHETVYTKQLEDNNSGPYPYWKYKEWRPASRSSSSWWHWRESWWSSWEFKESQWKRMHAKVCDRTGQPVVYRSLAKTSDEWLSRIYSILLQIDRLQLTAVYCNRRGV